MVALALSAFLARPACEPLDEEEVRTMNPPISRRTDRTLWWKSYQIKDNRWCQCKPWIERALFF